MKEAIWGINVVLDRAHRLPRPPPKSGRKNLTKQVFHHYYKNHEQEGNLETDRFRPGLLREAYGPCPAKGVEPIFKILLWIHTGIPGKKITLYGANL